MCMHVYVYVSLSLSLYYIYIYMYNAYTYVYTCMRIGICMVIRIRMSRFSAPRLATKTFPGLGLLAKSVPVTVQ